MNPSRWITRHRLSLAVGLATTLLGCLAWVGGLLTRLDNYGLDLHFRYFSSIAADPRIVMIDIDDRALESVPYSFPWPRRVFADVVSLLDELGAKTIVLDIVFDTADEPRQVDAALGKNHDIDTGLSITEDDVRGPPIYIHDDNELAAAMAKANNVLIPMFFTPLRSSTTPTVDIDYFQMVRDLEKQFEIDVSILAGRGIRTNEYVRAKRQAARQLAEKFLLGNPNASFNEFLDFVMPPETVDTRGYEREELIRGFRYNLSLRDIRSRSIDVTPPLDAVLPRALNVTVPLDKFTTACKDIGFAGWDRESSGPIVRELPLLANMDDKLVVQLGLLATLNSMKVDIDHVKVGDHVLQVEHKPTWTRMLQLNSSMESLINWHTEGTSGWSETFHHIPITYLLGVIGEREAIAANDNRVRAAFGRLVTLRHASTPSELSNYTSLVHSRRALEGDVRTASTVEDEAAIKEELETISIAIQEFENEAITWLTRSWQLWKDQEPEGEVEANEKAAIKRLYYDLVAGELTREMARLNSGSQSRATCLVDSLKSEIKDKTCFVGYTASAQADLVATPVHPAMPGVMVHANIANTILQNRPAWRASTSINLTCLVVLGMLVTFLSSTRGGVFAVGALVFLLMLTLFAGAYVFKHWVYHLPTIATCVTAMFVWASVTLCRQLIEERSRKRFQAALAQYTSPAIAAQIADRASAIDLAPRSAVVSCFFADLQGFTTLSEKLGPERTQRVLNPYLKAVSDVLIRHNAMVNKFMGDGIFAFFNAPIWPCKDPAAAACRSALAAQQALNELNRSTIAKEAGVPLKMRIGLSTGEVFVGDYGSDTKLDYTCIGDNVNIAGRLQAANKEFGTGILVDDQTKKAAGDQFGFRPIGDQKLTGKTQTVAVYELTGFGKPGTTAAENA